MKEGVIQLSHITELYTADCNNFLGAAVTSVVSRDGEEKCRMKKMEEDLLERYFHR
jgi:hypothetical protein